MQGFATPAAGVNNRPVDFQTFLTRFGVAVKRRRKEKELTQYELADRVGVEQPTIHRVEKGRQGWDSKTVFNIAAALECSLADLFIEVEQVITTQLPPEASSFARTWMMLPPEMREEYRRRIEGLADAMRFPVPDEVERRRREVRRPDRRPVRARRSA